MVYNLRFDKLKKQISDTGVMGFILVTFSDRGKTKVISTKRTISRAHFDRFFNKDFKRFAPTSVIDSKGINDIIEQIVKDQNPFEVKPVIGFVAYCTKQLKYQLKPNTKTSYQYVIKSFEAFLATMGMKDIPFARLNIELFREYKLFLDTEDKLTSGTIKYNFIVLKSFINRANDDELCFLNLPLKKFNLEGNPKRPTVLSDSDIDSLLAVPTSNPLYKYVQFSLLQLFSNGLRFSDCLLIKLSDFKADYLEVRTMKVKIVLHIPYTPMMIDIVYRIMGMEYIPSIHPYNRAVNISIKDHSHEFINAPKREHILYYIKDQPDRFLFDFADPILFDIDKSKAMKPDQHYKYLLIRMYFNSQLAKLIKPLEMSVTKYTSHSMRYAYTRLAIQNKIPIHLLSKSLGHSSVGITERYIRETFNIEDYSAIGDMMTSKFKLGFDMDK